MIDGTCTKCGEIISTYQIRSHINRCILNSSNGNQNRSFILKIVDEDVHRYWMFVKMSETATLDDLDDILRDVWLECCGHLSMFKIANIKYEQSTDFNKEYGTKNSNIQVNKILIKDMKFNYTYDLGSETTLGITVYDIHHDYSPPKNKVEILIRNNQIDHSCKLCGKKAELICAECYYDEEIFLCESCEDKHGHITRPVANSPRMGVCGYGLTDSSTYVHF